MGLSVSLYSAQCPHCLRRDLLYHDNITHNVRPMAIEAGVYEPLWREPPPTASGLIEPLREAIRRIEHDASRYVALQTPNGFGTQRDFEEFLDNLMAACVENPDAVVLVSV